MMQMYLERFEVENPYVSNPSLELKRFSDTSESIFLKNGFYIPNQGSRDRLVSDGSVFRISHSCCVRKNVDSL